MGLLRQAALPLLPLEEAAQTHQTHHLRLDRRTRRRPRLPQVLQFPSRRGLLGLHFRQDLQVRSKHTLTQVEVSPKEDKQKQLQFKEVEEFKLSYHVINCRTSRSLMAARTAEPVVHLYRLNKPGSPPNKLSSSETLQNTNSTLAWRGDSEKLGAATNSRRICIWDITSQKATEVVQYHKKDITDLIWLNNKCLASSSNNGEICM